MKTIECSLCGSGGVVVWRVGEPVQVIETHAEKLSVLEMDLGILVDNFFELGVDADEIMELVDRAMHDVFVREQEGPCCNRYSCPCGDLSTRDNY